MQKEKTLAEAMPSPFFGLALDVGGEKGQPDSLRMIGESASDLGMALGAAMILEGQPPAIALGVMILTASLAARRKLKRLKMSEKRH